MKAKEKEFRNDPRFKICFKEMLLTYALQILFTIVVLGIAFIFGGKPLSEYSFILGMPSWWFAVLTTALLWIALVVFTSIKIFKDFKVDAYLDESKRD